MGQAGAEPDSVPVSGTGMHYFSTAIIHHREATATGEVVRSTDTVELHGDLEGRILYHPFSVFDYEAGTLVNTGSQVFSGAVLGGGPVLLYDDQYRFEVNLATGETVGSVLLTQPLAGNVQGCELTVTGPSGPPTEAGDMPFLYEGECVMAPDPD